ncbi:MAG: hypothetical protein EBV32_00225 [Proteobacteria bacterium]|uniref:Uncharacterized protein n=1 Tax=Candidatus Fonsibacter lacus TaxID=2576439 RepID=A0A964XRL5_9PROT|nr:hypothetical protein [Candidatus Fonsibacter lacus]NCU71545.1 hypothetical protein [Candidatus Fonsibacter lacus]
MSDLDWTELFRQRPDLSPPGYEEAVRDAKAISEARYVRDGKKRAKGSNARKPLQESRQAADARKRKFPSLKHGQQD